MAHCLKRIELWWSCGWRKFESDSCNLRSTIIVSSPLSMKVTQKNLNQ